MYGADDWAAVAAAEDGLPLMATPAALAAADLSLLCKPIWGSGLGFALTNIFYTSGISQPSWLGCLREKLQCHGGSRSWNC